MEITLKNLDPEIAGTILASSEAQEVLGVPKITPKSDPAQKPAPLAAAGRIAKAIFAGLLTLLASLVMMGVAVEQKVPDSVIALSFFALLAIIPICAANWVRSGSVFRNSAQAAVPDAESARQNLWARPLRFEEMQALGATGAFTPRQGQYLDALSALLQLNQQGQVDDARAASLLAHLNGLLVSEHELQAQQKSVEDLRQPGQVRQIEAEQKDLEERLQTVRDPGARQALEQSLEMCRARLSSLGELAPLAERLAAQRTVVQQTLAALEASLSRMLLTKKSAGKASTDLLNIEGIQQSVVEIQRESRSTDQAVQEVLALRAS